MDFDDYQKLSRKTATYPNLGDNFIYPTLGLTGEAGEVANKVKKIQRDRGGVLSDEDKKELSKEIGDVLWYIANLCSELKLNLSTVAKENIKKLSSRVRRYKLFGSGDNR